MEPEISKAAKEAGVSPKTIYTWFRQPEFIEALNEATNEAIRQVSRDLVGLGIKAIKHLHEVIDDPETLTRDRIRSIALVLDNLIKYRELSDIEARLTNLEEMINDN